MVSWSVWHAGNQLYFENCKINPHRVVVSAEAMISSFRREMLWPGIESVLGQMLSKDNLESGNWSLVKVECCSCSYWWYTEQNFWFGGYCSKCISRNHCGSCYNYKLLWEMTRCWTCGGRSSDNWGANSYYWSSLMPWMLFNLLRERSRSKKEICWVISDIQSQIKDVNQFRIDFIPRFRNLEVRRLAKHTISNHSCFIWLEEIPANVSAFLGC